MKNLCVQLLSLIRAMPRLRKYILGAFGIGLAGSLIAMFISSAGHASFAAHVLTR